MKDKELTTTDRQIATLIETNSRILRQVELIRRGKTFALDGTDRLDIVKECAIKNSDILKSI